MQGVERLSQAQHRHYPAQHFSYTFADSFGHQIRLCDGGLLKQEAQLMVGNLDAAVAGETFK